MFSTNAPRNKRRLDDMMDIDETPPMKKSKSGDEQYLEYASEKTRLAYDGANAEGKDAILFNVANKYRPIVDELNNAGIFDLIDQLDKGCNLNGGRKKKMRGGDIPAVKAALKKLWVEIVAATFTPDNILKGVPVAVIGVANPTLAGSLFAAAKTAIGAASAVCFTSAGMTAISIGALMYLYDVKVDINSLTDLNAKDKEALTALREALQKNLKASAKFGSVAKPSEELLKKVELLKQQQEKASKAPEDATGKAAAAITTELEKVSKEAAAISETAAPPTTPAAPADAVMKTGGRKTKKRGLKKLRKTRRSMFKY